MQTSNYQTIDCDVLVVGGGTGGSMAAMAAAEEGATVVLVDQARVLGGIGTIGAMHAYHYGLASGMFTKVDELASEISCHFGEASRRHPESKRCAINRFVEDRSITVISGQPFEALMDGDRIRGVLVQTDDATLAVTCQVVVDSTGDADIAALAGAQSVVGRAWDEVANAYSLFVRCVEGGTRLTKLGSDAGWVDMRDLQDYTRAYLYARARLFGEMQQASGKRPLGFYPTLSVRAGRYTRGEYTLTLEDVVERRSFPDGVMLCYAHYDPHALDYANESELAQLYTCVMGLWGLPIGCQIPYRCFLPKGVDGLLIGSRAISLTPDAAMAVRMQRDVQVMGEVAGVAAALAVKLGTLPRRLEVATLKERLSERGIVNDLASLSRLETSTGKAPTTWVTGQEEFIDEGRYLDDLKTPQESRAVAWWLKEEDDYLELLGTPGEGKALWHIYRQGETYAEPLLELLASATGLRKRGAAFGLALLGHADGLEELLACVRRRDSDVPSGRHTQPRWIGALALLNLLKTPRAFGVTVELLSSEDPLEPSADDTTLRDEAVAFYEDDPWVAPETMRVSALLFALHYLYKVLHQLDPEQKNKLCEHVDKFLDRGLGDSYMLYKNQTKESVRWSLETTAAGLLARCGRERGQTVLQSYMSDPRRYVRNAASLRLQEVTYERLEPHV